MAVKSTEVKLIAALLESEAEDTGEEEACHVPWW